MAFATRSLMRAPAARHLIAGLASAGRPQAYARASGFATSASSFTGADGATLPAPRICIVGGGFGGLYTAIRLEKLLWPKGSKPQITVIDQNDRFIFKPLLYELVNDTASAQEVAPLFCELLAPYPITFVQSKVAAIEPSFGGVADAAGNAGCVQLSDGCTVEYDYLVVALGARSDSRGVPGVDKLAVPFNSYEDAMKIKLALDNIMAVAGTPTSVSVPPSVVVVGAGYAGVELATVVAERVGGNATVRLVSPGSDIMDGSPDGQREAARKALSAAGVGLMTGTRVKSVMRPPGSTAVALSPSPATACMVSLAVRSGDGGASGYDFDESEEEVFADLVVWTAGSSPITPAGRTGFPFRTNARGSVKTEPTLQVLDYPNVFAVGDVSETGGGHTSRVEDQALPQTAQVAFQQADYVAWNLWSAINKRPMLPFRYQHLGSMMSLGQLNGAVALPIMLPPPLKSLVQGSPLESLLNVAGVSISATDPDNSVTLEGPLAALARRAAYLYRQPTNEQRVSVAASWLQQAAKMAGGLASGASRQ